MNLDRLKKINVRIEIKKEKEIKQFIVLLLLTAVLSFVLFEWRDLTWNILLYKYSADLILVLVAVPSFIFYCKRNKKISELFVGDKKKQILIGLLIGVGCALLVLFALKVVMNVYVARLYPVDFWSVLKKLVHYLFFVAFTEEFIYRVEFQERLEGLLGKYRFVAPLISAILFGWVHIISGTWRQVVLAFLFGCVLGYAKLFNKNCTYLSVVIAHGVYDVVLVAVPTILYYCSAF